MEDTDKCVILKKKEYDKLVQEAESKKPDYIELWLYYPSYWSSGNYSAVQTHKLELGKNLMSQIYNIRALAIHRLNSMEEQIIDQAKNDTYHTLAKMSWWERRKFLKKYE